MAKLTRGTHRLDWLTGRIRVEEILAAADETAPPAKRPGGPHLALTTGPLQSRRTTRLPAPPPRIRPTDLEAVSSGVALYGQRAIVPWPYRDWSVSGVRPADVLGTVASYTVPDNCTAARFRFRVGRTATNAALVMQVQLTRAGRTYVLWELPNMNLESVAVHTLLPGDVLAVVVSTVASAAGIDAYALVSVEERV